MNKYKATVRVGGSFVNTIVFADSPIHARLLLQYSLGMNCIISSPTQTTNEDNEGITIEEAIGIIKPLTPAQAKVKSLQAQKDNANKALKAERKRQTIQKAQQTIYKASIN